MKFPLVLLFGWSISAVHYHYHLAGPVDTQTLQNMIQMTQAHFPADGKKRGQNERDLAEHFPADGKKRGQNERDLAAHYPADGKKRGQNERDLAFESLRINQPQYTF